MKDFFDTWKFKILVAVAVFLVGIMAYAGANGRLTAAPQELLGVILTPFQKAAAMVGGGVGAVWEKYTSIDEVMEQNEQLEAENAELRQQMVDYDRLKAENKAYKALANIQEKNSDSTYVSAFVIGRDPLDEFGSFTLDKGTADGVEVSDAVISDRGYLLGMVVEADLTSCKVMTILHPSFNAAGVVSRNRENGILNGNTTYAPDGLCTLTNLERIRSSPPVWAGCSRRICWWARCRTWCRRPAVNPPLRWCAPGPTPAPPSTFLSLLRTKEGTPLWNLAASAAAASC